MIAMDAECESEGKDAISESGVSRSSRSGWAGRGVARVVALRGPATGKHGRAASACACAIIANRATGNVAKWRWSGGAEEVVIVGHLFAGGPGAVSNPSRIEYFILVIYLSICS